MRCPAQVSTVAVLASLIAADARAQTQLPPITVTTPSPVTRAQESPAAAVAQPKQAIPAPQAQLPAAEKKSSPGPALAPVGTVPPLNALPGTLLVVPDAFSPVTLVSERDVLSGPGATLTDALQSRPGITGSTFAPGASRPIIRGLDNHRVRVQENGVGSHDASTLSEDHAVPIDPLAAQRIEVVRGPATLRYGSQAIGGVVAVENDRIPTAIPRNGYAAEVRGGLSSVDRGHDGAFRVTAGAGAFAVHADAFRRRAGDYDTPQGRQLNSFVESDGFSVGGSIIGPNGFAGVSFSRFTSLYGIPGEEAADHRPRIDLAQDKLQSKGEWRVRDYGVEAIRYWFGSTRYGHNEVVFEDGEGDIIGTRFTNRQVEARTEVQHLPIRTSFGELRGAAGIQFDRKRIAGFGVDEPVDGLLDPAARQRALAAFLFEELQVSKVLRLQAAARIETNMAEGTGIVDAGIPTDPEVLSRKFRPKSGSVGLLYQLPMGVVARLTGQYTERAPDVAELFSKGVHEATGTFEIGNPNLKIEKAQTLELGFKKAEGALRFDASLFRTAYRGFIFKNFTNVQCGDTLATCGVEPELDQIVYAQRDATFHGAELAAQFDVAKIWRGTWGIDGQYDFVRARFAEGGNVPRIPPHRVGAGVYYRDMNWFARVGFLRAFDQDKIASLDPKDTPTDGYALVNAELAYTWTTWASGPAQQWTIGLKGENLLDDDVRNHVSFKKDEVLQPGRTFRLFGSVKLN